MKRALLVLVFLLCLPCAAYAAESADELDALEQNLLHAANLMREGRAQEAGEIYAALNARYPANSKLALARARAALAAGDAETALPIYDRLVAEDPDNAELRMEAARANRLGGQAPGEYEGGNRLQIQGAVRIGATYDSNVNQGPASNNIRLGGWNVQLSDGRGKPSGAAYVRANVNMGYRLGDYGPWWFAGDLGVFWRGNFNGELDGIDSRTSQWGRVAAGLRYLDGINTFDMRLKAEISDYDFKSNVSSLGAELRYIRVINPRLHLITDASYERRTYSGGGERDGGLGGLSGYARFFMGNSRHELLIGGGYMSASANHKDYGYDGWHALARYSFKLPNGLVISPLISVTREFYNGPATALETEKRRDERLRAGMDVTYALNSAWSVEAAYHFTNSISNSELYTYDQHVVSLGVARTF